MLDIFIIFVILVESLVGIAMLFTGLFVWGKLKDDFEARTLGGVLALISILFFIMGFRDLFWALEWIDEDIAFNIFFGEYILIIFLLLPFAFPRFLYLVFNKPIAKTIGRLLGTCLFILYLILHLKQREKIVAHFVPQGLSFEPPYSEKIFLAGVFSIFLLMMLHRASFHFIQWRKTRAFPYRFLIYLLFFFTFLTAMSTVLPKFQPWQVILGYVLALAAILGIYFVFSQETIKLEGVPQPTEEVEKRAKELEEKVSTLEKLQNLVLELKKDVDLRAEELMKEIERLKKE